jgi:TRAP transporter TAXI family solute receptor
METLGVNADVSYAGASDAAGQLKDGLIDAFAFAAGIPISAFAQLAAENDVLMFGLNEEEQATVLEGHPEMAAFTIPTGTYQGHDYDQPTVGLWNFAIAHQDMPESLAYEITKLVLENNERMMQIHATSAETVIENWDKNSVIPFHPGAVRYLEEQGLTVPDDLKG